MIDKVNQRDNKVTDLKRKLKNLLRNKKINLLPIKLTNYKIIEKVKLWRPKIW